MNTENFIRKGTQKYKKDFKIGSGTFGDAYHVTSLMSGRGYVMKEVPLSSLTDENARKTLQEAEVLSRCKHINIIRYKESFVSDTPRKMCLVMEYADGGDLEEKIRQNLILQKFFPESTVLNWFIQIVFAVQYLHKNNILHRDLKARNIFLTYKNIIKVGDFGIARFLRFSQDLASTAIGTPFYLSPEICLRNPYNHKSDIWAMGCILYEICALHRPFLSDQFDVLVTKILSLDFEPLDRSYSPLVHDLVSVLLRKNPERRPSADDILLISPLRAIVQSYIKKHEKLLASIVQDGHGSNPDTPSPKERPNQRCFSPSEKRVYNENDVTQKQTQFQAKQFALSRLKKSSVPSYSSPDSSRIEAEGTVGSPSRNCLRHVESPHSKSPLSENCQVHHKSSPDFGKTYVLHSPR